ncbi:hypothetical protein ABW19_dt0206257 [Dactylella cylindrospora]|nr:hypothetical protein ABW19_dt0206257 [Dactylella cylindrospora]
MLKRTYGVIGCCCVNAVLKLAASIANEHAIAGGIGLYSILTIALGSSVPYFVCKVRSGGQRYSITALASDKIPSTRSSSCGRLPLTHFSIYPGTLNVSSTNCPVEFVTVRSAILTSCFVTCESNPKNNQLCEKATVSSNGFSEKLPVRRCCLLKPLRSG